MKSEERHKYLDLCIPYILGRLNPGNRKQFEEHLSTGCETCTTELAELQEALALLPLTLAQQAPPSRVKEKLLSTLRTGRRPAERPVERRAERPAERPAARPSKPVEPALARPRQRPWFGYGLALAILLIFLVLLFYTNDLVSTIGGQGEQIAQLQEELERSTAVLGVLQSARIEVVALSGSEANMEGYGRIIWDPESKRAILHAANLPLAPEGKNYQLWIFKEGEPASAGVFTVTGENERERLFRVMNLPVVGSGEIDSFTVTLEPREGSPQPSGAVFLRGSTRR